MIARQIAALVFLSCCSLVQAETSVEQRAASVLLQQFETVAYSEADLLTAPQADSAEREVDSLKEMRLPFFEFLGGLESLRPSLSGKLAGRCKAVLAGAKAFTAPSGLGAVHSRRCYVGTLKDGSALKIVAEFSQTASELMDGRRVWTWSVPPSEGDAGPTEFYAAQIAGG